MFKFIKFIKYGIYVILVSRIFSPTISTNLSGTDSANEGEPSTSEQQSDPFKTTFEGELVNLDINAMHGYSKFNCTITYTEVVYQSACKFKSALDGDYEIWKAENNKYAFRYTLQFLDKLPLSLMIELDRNDKSTALYFRRKYNARDWEKLDEQGHKDFVDKFKQELEKHKNTIKEDSKTSVDLDVVIDQASNEVELNIHKYSDNAPKLSDGTVTAIANNEQIDKSKYSVKCNTVTDGTGKNFKTFELDLTDKKYRIYKVKIKGTANIKSDVWKTGGNAFCTKILATTEGDKYDNFDLTLVYKDSGKRTKLTLEGDKTWQWIHSISEVKEVDLPTFDFNY